MNGEECGVQKNLEGRRMFYQNAEACRRKKKRRKMKKGKKTEKDCDNLLFFWDIKNDRKFFKREILRKFCEKYVKNVKKKFIKMLQ